MTDPLKFTPIEGVLGVAMVLAIVATVLIYLRCRNSARGGSTVLIGLALAWFVPVVGPVIVIGLMLVAAKREQLRKREQHT